MSNATPWTLDALRRFLAARARYHVGTCAADRYGICVCDQEQAEGFLLTLDAALAAARAAGRAEGVAAERERCLGIAREHDAYARRGLREGIASGKPGMWPGHVTAAEDIKAAITDEDRKG